MPSLWIRFVLFIYTCAVTHCSVRSDMNIEIISVYWKYLEAIHSPYAHHKNVCIEKLFTLNKNDFWLVSCESFFFWCKMMIITMTHDVRSQFYSLHLTQILEKCWTFKNHIKILRILMHDEESSVLSSYASSDILFIRINEFSMKIILF